MPALTMEPALLPLGKLGIDQPIEHWWQWAFIGIAAASALAGSISFSLILVGFSRTWSKRDRRPKSVPSRVKSLLQFHDNDSSKEIISEKPRLPASSFGVYLGAFASPPTRAQIEVLSRWDILVVDPTQSGVLEAVTAVRPSAQHSRLGRIHLRELHVPKEQQDDQDIIVAVEKLRDLIDKKFKHSSPQPSAFTGVLLAGWEEWLPMPVFDTLVWYIRSHGLDVYLEIAPPDFLNNRDTPDMSNFSGVVVRNGTILSSGHVRDFFQMAVMKSTVKAFVTQTCLRDFRVMVWETVDDPSSLSHSVIKRCYIWCRYYSAMVFINSKAGLLDASSEGIPEPLAAFQWLKDQRVMKIHNHWRSTHKLVPYPSVEASLAKLERIVPSLTYLTPDRHLLGQRGNDQTNDEDSAWELATPSTQNINPADDVGGSQWFRKMPKVRGSPLSFSPSGESYNLLGCFPIGLDATQEDFNQIVQTQRHLKRMGKLDQMPPSNLRTMGGFFRKLYHEGFQHNSQHIDNNVLHSINDLAGHLWAASDSEEIMDPIEIYIGLDSGFRRPNGVQFWAVYEVDLDTGSLNLYISRYCADYQNTILHAYLSSRGCSRHACFAAEISADNVAAGQTRDNLPTRIVKDTQLLTPSDIIFFFQHMKSSDPQIGDTLVTRIRSLLEEQILDGPSFGQLRELDTAGYLSGRIPEQMIIESRGFWYEKHGYQHFDFEVALRVFRDVEANFVDILCSGRNDDLERITDVLESAITPDGFDAYTDVVALAIFCAARKAAYNEIYLEVSDRNPLFNEYSDQAGAFSELFALGSRCEDYFDLTPSAFGKLLSDRHRAHYGKPHNQPPLQIGYADGFSSSYAVAQIDIDDTAKAYQMPAYQRLTFLSVFAVPAFIDIMLLTTTGHGLYLSSFMSHYQSQSATTALMISLPLSSAIGTWIAIGGSYYLNSVAFPAANLYVTTRFIGGLVITFVIGILGFIIISAVNARLQDGIVFLLYFVALTTYLSLLAVLSCYQYHGSPFQNGRTTIFKALPILGVAPILTIFVLNHDAIIYLLALYIFIGALVFGVRSVGSKWVTWYHKVTAIDDKKLKEWFIKEKGNGNPKTFSGMTDPAALVLARDSLLKDVEKERKRKPWMPATTDKLVLKLAEGWDATIFLLQWYCRLQGSKQPIPFSSTWNVQVKVGLASLIEAQRGIRLHNGFVLWRQAGDEVVCGVLYFLIALLDKWIELLSGGNLLGLSAAVGDSMRKSVGLGLAYYLMGSVILDYKAYSLNGLIDEQNPEPISSAGYVREAVLKNARSRQKLYITTLVKFLSVHAWSLAFCTTILYILDGSKDGLITYLAYVAAYSGLLLYQYNKVFSGPRTKVALLIAIMVALPLGLVLRGLYPRFQYNTVIPLGVATWIAALLSLRTAKIGMPKLRVPVDPGAGGMYHAYLGLGEDKHWSQNELGNIYANIAGTNLVSSASTEANSLLGIEVRAILMSCSEQYLSPPAAHAFPESYRLVGEISKKWNDGTIKLHLIQMQKYLPREANFRALTCFNSDGGLHIVVNLPDEGNSKGRPFANNNYQFIAEVMLHAGAEFLLRLPHESGVLAESLPACRTANAHEKYKVSEGVRREVAKDETSGKRVQAIMTAKRELLYYSCFGVDCELGWDKLPGEIRSVLFRRCLGERYELTPTNSAWLQRNLLKDAKIDLPTHIAQCDFGVLMAVNKLKFFKTLRHDETLEKLTGLARIDMQSPSSDDYHFENEPTPSKNYITRSIASIYHGVGIWLKFFIVSLIADPEFHRELKFTLGRKSQLFATVVTSFLSVIWMTARIAQHWLLPWFLFHNREKAQKVWDGTKGTVYALKKNRLIIRSLDETSTCFFHVRPILADFKLCKYSKLLEKEPEGAVNLQGVSHFSKEMILKSREEYGKNGQVSTYVYEYANKITGGMLRKNRNPRIPLSRTCTAGPDEFQTVHYNKKGFIESGSYVFKDTQSLVRFKYHYRKNAKFDDELLRAEFVFPHVTCNINWCAPPARHAGKMERWIPHSRVTEATFVRGEDVYESTWFYDHQHHPTITTQLNGVRVDTPDMILEDWLGVLKKPINCNFAMDNPLLEFPSLKTTFFSRLLRSNKKRSPISTSRARSQLWRAWKNDKYFDGVLTRWLDERIMREEPLLKTYWQRRDRGALAKAEKYLIMHTDAIMASSELSNDISSWTPLAIKLGDLHGFGQGGDALMFTRSQHLQLDTNDSLHVMAVDTGTWPNEGGGVSACRRDVINNLRSIKWHMLVESANDFGLPKHQIEENVQSLKVLPLWGLDFLHPVHGVFHNKLDSEVNPVAKNAKFEDIEKAFIPALTALVKAARAVTLSPSDVHQASRALVDLNSYFEGPRHWASVWTSDAVKNAWRNLWLSETMPNTTPPSEWFETEHPTLGHLDAAMDLWFRYLFVLSIPVPEEIPNVFQASHHSVSAAYGVVCKMKRGCTLQIWDHAISWRETNLYLSSALCILQPFVRNSLLGLMRVTAVLVLNHADQILPCADFFNIGWEIEVGSHYGHVQHRKRFARKIDPVVNGIPDMKKFSPVTEITTEKPTVTMLSHVWFAKDIKTAILAANVIVNEWGFKDYRLHIYGALDKSPVYSAECQEILASKSLGENLTMMGTADPKTVLATSWLFLNSSVSEGLPLALGEAALTGVPVVCTDVGASLRVLTDKDDGSRYSEVVAPNDAASLARAQINILAMIGEWAKYAEDAPGEKAPILPFKPGPEDVAIITARMYAKQAQRRKLGLMARNIVQKAFSGERYLREHEQMLWIGKCTSLQKKGEDMEDFSSGQNDIYAPATSLVAPAAMWSRTRPSSGRTSFTSVDDDANSIRESVWGNSPAWNAAGVPATPPVVLTPGRMSPAGSQEHLPLWPSHPAGGRRSMSRERTQRPWAQQHYSRSNLSVVSSFV
ncbi:glycosyl transferase [Drepanopeziza brunnea f. sp. 'multigermtubi' MB_m1]|uniref:Glycosyl transferase n=1 Tax=Marssonina brunnea f. sp. multigermtubi (strain MB_m1) TaxID=1072389 RepID=K1WTR2_MARBU|nr:glycosyl transferase [Drepanopeziza brunnea f. sp. 'multigermtubi' MB_m1]EKD21030.1 glycosyl transferase [Drepanopeziza brunnea f. sp. 'multigermtubi' MB_m1]